jgi:RNA-directed DNA polymerase
MSGDAHVRFREGLGVRFPWATRRAILCRTAHDAQRALALVQAWVAENGLTLHPTKTRIVDAASDGFDFLGYHFHGTRRGIRHRVRDKSVRKLKDALRQKTKRTSGRSLSFIIADVNRVLRGWFAYFQHDQWYTFDRLDCWLRQRLRAILRKRSKRRGVAKGRRDFQRWPNAYFLARGLYSLAAARLRACQSLRR